MTLLRVENLKTYYRFGNISVRAVDGVSLEIGESEAIGLAGESGCGKTTLGCSLIRLVPEPGQIVGGRIFYRDEDLLRKNEAEMRSIRGKNISMIFQAAMNSLNPVVRVGDQIAENILSHEENVSKEEAMKRVRSMFRLMGIEESRAKNYPHEFSGGMKQRAMIAIALANNPDFIIADEPTTALDVTVQAQIIRLMKNLQRDFGMSLILITHDLSVIAETCEKVAVMYAGKIVELSSTDKIFEAPIHPYTKGLVEAIPVLERAKSKTLFTIPGFPPNLANPPTGCRFHLRCPYAQFPICKEQEPYDNIPEKWFVACHFARDLVGVAAHQLWTDTRGGA
ncbi:ABC transporter ATP-binding protein [Candidatus Bathyarchaeota archaeon]|nr:ABC transporter ATP-binding protein [Candidatus Bathyarchaeota archaeon]